MPGEVNTGQKTSKKNVGHEAGSELTEPPHAAEAGDGSGKGQKHTFPK